ncbi:MAG TPA: glycosyltransferase family 4 protein, partial [Allocoleopsis sp.]
MSSAETINDTKSSDTSIVFVNPVGAIGGAERALLTIIAALKTAQPHLQLHLIVGTDGLLVEMAQNLGVQVRLLKLPDQLNQLGDSSLKSNSQPLQGTPGKSKIQNYITLLLNVAKALPSVAQYLGEFRQAIREINPDLIHSNGIKTHLLTALAGSMDVPVVWHIHDFYGSRPLMAGVLRWMSTRATLGIAISEAVAQDAKATLPGLPIEVIYNSVDTHYFSPGIQERFTEKYYSPSDSVTRSSNPIRVGLVATFARWKGHDIFLQAAARVIRAYPNFNVRFYIVGGAIYQTKGSQFSEQELKELAVALQIENDVEFLGFQSDIAEVYRWLDIVVHASTQPE